MIPDALNLVGYLLMEQPMLPPLPWPRGYVFAKNGVFAWARREGLEALIPASPCKLAGLYPVEPYVRLDYPPVDVWVLSEVLRFARDARSPQGGYLEVLFHLERDREQGWQLIVPAQQQEAFLVLPVFNTDAERLSYANTLLEVHSHHQMRAFFSDTDNAEEQGFRIYAVLGRIDGKGDSVEIRVRVGIYGHFWEIPASSVFSLPAGITDCVVRDQMRTREAGMSEDVPGGGACYGT